MKKISIYLLCFLVLLAENSMAQEDPVLEQALRNKNDISSILQTVKQYYRNPATVSRLGATSVNRSLKHWRRWEWYMSSRLGPSGEFVNIAQKMMQATGVQQNRSLSNAKIDGTLSVTGSWALVGPTNTTSGIGRADRLAFHPTNADIVYAGTTAGGLWRTTDAGANWTNLTTDLTSPGISGIVVDPNTPTTIYILTGDGDSNLGTGGLVNGFGYMRLSIGVLKSTDNGNNWKVLGVFPGADYSTLVAYRLIMHPTINTTLYACTSQGLYMSLNSGETWGLLKGGRFYDMAFRPNSTICYATSISGSNRASFWRSTTSGLVMDTIAAVQNQINNPSSRTEIAIAPSSPDVVYLLAGGVPGNGQFKGIYRSADAGLTFNLQANSPNILGSATDGSDNGSQATYDLAIAVSNTSSSTVVTGGIRVWRSLNSGNSWINRPGIHVDIHDIAFHPVDNKLWVANDGGVYSSTDNGANWTSHFEDMSIAQFYRMAVNPADYNQMLAGAQDNGTKRRSGPTSFFDNISGLDAFTVDYDFANQSIYYAVLNQNISKFTGNGAAIATISPLNSNNPFAMTMAVHTSLGDALFIGSDSLWRTTNGGANWNVNTAIGGWALRTCPSNGNRVYAAGGTAFNSATGILRRSDDGGATWPVANIVSNNPGFPTNYTKITYINVDPTNSLDVWVTFGGFNSGVKVYFSTDGGANWVNRSGSLPNVPVNCIAVDSDNNAYVGTDNGVYYRGASMSDWIPFYNNLPYVPVTDLVLSEPELVIRASTFGRGIWQSSMRSTCLDYQSIGGSLDGQRFYETADSINTTVRLDTTDGTKIQMRAGLQVRLNPGFSAYENTAFRALIGPCGSGDAVAGFRMSSNAQAPMPKKLFASGKRKATLHIVPGVSTLETIVTVNETGEISFVLTDTDGSPRHSWEKTVFQTGKSTRRFTTPAVAPGQYMLHVFHNGVWQHAQEVEVK